MKNNKWNDQKNPVEKKPASPDYSFTEPFRVMGRPAVKLRPRKPLWGFPFRPLSCDVCLPISVPQVQIIASKRVVQVGETFNIKVIGSSSVGLRGLWWFGRETGIEDMDKAHWHDLSGENFHEEIWQSVSFDQPGIYTLGANSRDTLYGTELGVPHQASEGAGISECVVEVREDISYDAQVDVTKAKFGKTSEWETWMKSAEVRTRYEMAWERSRAIPTMLKIAFHYGTTSPLAYNPPWADEHQHMDAVDDMASLAFPGLNFEFLYGADSSTTDMLIEVGGNGYTSHAGGSYGYLYYETIFGHEFGHILNIPHHYLGTDTSTKIFLPPGEEHCVMARNSNQYCSGCKAAMHLDLDSDTSDALSTVTSDILSRYPY